jgi:hypothetical protein
MEAQAWTAVALLGASLIGSFGYLGAHIDALGARIDEQGAPLGRARIDSLDDRLTGRIDALAIRVDTQTAPIDGMAAKVAALTVSLDDHLRPHSA